MGQLVDPPQEQPLGQGRQPRDDEGGERHRHPEAQAPLDALIREIRTEQVERPVGEVHELQQSEDDAQATARRK